MYVSYVVCICHSNYINTLDLLLLFCMHFFLELFSNYYSLKYHTCMFLWFLISSVIKDYALPDTVLH